MKFLTDATSNLGYGTQNTLSTNYQPEETSSGPESFPNLMNNGIIVDYETVTYIDEE